MTLCYMKKLNYNLTPQLLFHLNKTFEHYSLVFWFNGLHI